MAALRTINWSRGALATTSHPQLQQEQQEGPGTMSRTVAKTLSYSFTHLGVAVAVAYALTGDWRVALGIGLIEPALQTLVYALHERAWDRPPRHGRSRRLRAAAHG